MLLVKTKIKPSHIHGKGLFADQNIKKGQKIWIFNSKIDKKISKKELSNLTKSRQRYVKYWSYLNDGNQYVLCGDSARFINHSDNPNTIDVKTFLDKLLRREGTTFAAKDIRKGEEITSRYLRFTKKGKAKLL